MKSLGKLRRFALHKADTKEKREFLPSAHLDELAQAAKVLPQTVPLKLKLSLSLSLKILTTVIDCEFRKFCEIECVEVIESFFEGSSRFAWEAGNRFGSELITARYY